LSRPTAQLEQTVADISSSLAALEGFSESAAERAVLSSRRFPSHEVDPYRGMKPHFGVTSARARVLHAVATRNRPVIGASPAALLPKSHAPARLLEASIDLKPGQDISS